MNIHQTSSPEFQSPQNNQNIGGLSGTINHIEFKNLKSYLTKQNGKYVVCFVGKDDLLQFAFYVADKKIMQMNNFELGTLKAKWLGENTRNNFLPRLIKEEVSVRQFNDKIHEYLTNQTANTNNSKEVKNPDFPNGTYIYTNQHGKDFKVITMGGRVINITCDNNYIPPAQKAAITRAVNQNKLNKFKEFLPIPNTQLQVINDTSHQVESVINQPLEGEIVPNISDNLDIIYFNFESLKKTFNNNIDINSSKVLVPSLSILKLIITDIEIDPEDLEYFLSDKELIEVLFKRISDNLQSQLKTSHSNQIQVILDTLKVIFTSRLRINTSEETRDTFTEDLDIGDDLNTGFDNQEITEEEALNIAMQAHKANKQAAEFRNNH